MFNPTSPCIDCGKPITDGYWYYRTGHDGRKEGYLHSGCGDPFGIKAAIAAERERCAQIAEAIDSGRGNEKEIAKAIRAAQ